MKLNAQTIKKYFEGTSEQELRKFRDFLNTHPIKQTSFKGKSIPYCICGKGEKTMLTFSGGHSGPWAVYSSVLGFEKEFQLVVVDFSGLDSLEDFSRCVNHVLESEGIDRVYVTGQSLTGMFAQAYFRRNVDRVEAMVLTNTLAPKKESNKKAALFIFRIFPSFLLMPLIKKKLGQIGKIDAEIPPEVEERMRFRMALLRHDMDKWASKRTLFNVVRMLFEFNGKDDVPTAEIGRWPGRVLIVTSEDEPYRDDVELLRKQYPRSEIYTFPAGWRHAAPLVHTEKFQKLIRDFFLEDRQPSSE